MVLIRALLGESSDHRNSTSDDPDCVGSEQRISRRRQPGSDIVHSEEKKPTLQWVPHGESDRHSNRNHKVPLRRKDMRIGRHITLPAKIGKTREGLRHEVSMTESKTRS